MDDLQHFNDVLRSIEESLDGDGDIRTPDDGMALWVPIIRG